jgi:hypothetical protein
MPDGAIGDPHPVAIALPDLAADAARQTRQKWLRRENVVDARTNKLPGDIESLFRNSVWSALGHPTPSPEVRSAAFYRSGKYAVPVKQFQAVWALGPTFRLVRRAVFSLQKAEIPRSRAIV